VASIERICQLTGEHDRTGWNGIGRPPRAFNRSVCRARIRGTDLGASFEHKNRLYFLFGDTWRVGDTEKTHRNLDAIAYTTDTTVNGGIHLVFNEAAPLLPYVRQGAYEVPLDGFSLNGRMFVFFSTGYHQVFFDPAKGEGEPMMGRSVLAVSDNDGYDFSALGMFSQDRFINVSVERARLSPGLATKIGWEPGARILRIWGSGAYRKSGPYLAVANLDLMLGALVEGRLADLEPISARAGAAGFLRYYAGGKGSRWSTEEKDAVPLFAANDIGELSCRWNPVFDSFFFTYNSGDPRGIVLRHAPDAWGPWSLPILIFDPRGHPRERRVGAEGGIGDPYGTIYDGYGKFMHISWSEARVDWVQDCMFLKGRRDHEYGAEYGPYQISRYTRGTRWQHCDLYFVMSTWNPYQVVLMRSRLTAADLDFVPQRWISDAVRA
jgi:hypothetical protein